MKVLVINSGSSSVKIKLFDMDNERVLASGGVERIGEDRSLISHTVAGTQGEHEVKRKEALVDDHHEALQRLSALLLDSRSGVIKDEGEIAGVGHRVVHGGASLQETTPIDDTVMAAIEANVPLAPLHNPANLEGVKVAMDLFPEVPQVAVFDTAFHQTMPPRAFLYAIPYDLYATHGIRRYGFQGTSHVYVAETGAAYLGRRLKEMNLITLHLGNGASMAAIRHGICVDTTMGLTPLEGLVMGTRSGDVDPALHFFLADHLGFSADEVQRLLNHESGLKGFCGTNDMREVLAQVEQGDERARLALDVYTYRIRKYIGAYFAVLEKVDAVIFTAGIGEHAPVVRELCCRGLQGLGIEIDKKRNEAQERGVREISLAAAAVPVLVVPTNEALRIARETRRVLQLTSRP